MFVRKETTRMKHHDLQDEIAATQIRCYQAQRVASLMTKPLFSDDDLTEIFAIPKSSLLALKRSLKLPQFKIGKRRFITRDALLSWIAERGGQASE
jgi:hypothetical protein